MLVSDICIDRFFSYQSAEPCNMKTLGKPTGCTQMRVNCLHSLIPEVLNIFIFCFTSVFLACILASCTCYSCFFISNSSKKQSMLVKSFFKPKIGRVHNNGNCFTRIFTSILENKYAALMGSCFSFKPEALQFSQHHLLGRLFFLQCMVFTSRQLCHQFPGILLYSVGQHALVLLL